MPTAMPSPTLGPSPTPALTEPPSTEALALVERGAALGCEALQTSGRDERTGVLARVSCTSPDDVIGEITLQTFDDATALRTSWQSSSTASTSTEASEEACANGEPGRRKWGFGNLACERADGVARIVWTDARPAMMGEVQGTTDDLSALFSWWHANARQLGRGQDPGDGEGSIPPKNEPDKVQRKLVRVPGKPRAASCEAAGPTIPDEWDRKWRIRRVTFENHAGYERVILRLEGRGKNQRPAPTQARIRRMTLSRLAEVVPNAPRPRRGTVAIVVELDGVRDAPNLRRYRPSSINLVRELSIVPNGGGRTIVLSTPAATCYQVRIPVWGGAATGKERSASIFIDLTQR